MLKEKSRMVFDWVKEHDGDNFTAQDIADALNLNVKSVNGIVTRAFQLHKTVDGDIVALMERIPAEIELEDGTHKPIKLIRLTDAGRAFDPDVDDKPVVKDE